MFKTKSEEGMMGGWERDVRQDQSCENHHFNISVKAEYMKHMEYLKVHPTYKFEDNSFPPIMSSLFPIARKD